MSQRRNHQLDRTLQETRTALEPREVLERAKRFFARQVNIYAAFPEQDGPTHVTLRGQGGEEIVIGVSPIPGGTLVRGSTYMFDAQVARFFATLPPAPQESETAAAPAEEAAPAAAGEAS